MSDAYGEATLGEPASVIRSPTAAFPAGYHVGITRYADIIMRDAMPQRFADLIDSLNDFRIDAAELVAGGGNRGTHTKRFDDSLASRGWGKRNITIDKLIDGRPIYQARGHEIDMFGEGPDGPYPGVGVEMEWNNKDPFYDRDLLNFLALHREGAIAVGVIVTRGPRLQGLLRAFNPKFGQSTTHWGKLEPRVNLGGGGECPLILIGIEPERINNRDLLVPVTRGTSSEARV